MVGGGVSHHLRMQITEALRSLVGCTGGGSVGQMVVEGRRKFEVLR